MGPWATSGIACAVVFPETRPDGKARDSTSCERIGDEDTRFRDMDALVVELCVVGGSRKGSTKDRFFWERGVGPTA